LIAQKEAFVKPTYASFIVDPENTSDYLSLCYEFISFCNMAQPDSKTSQI